MQPYIAMQPYKVTQNYGALQQPNNTSLSPYLQHNYAQPSYSQNSYSQPFLPASNSGNSLLAQQFNTASPSYAQQHDFQPARPSYANAGQNPSNYLAQAVSSNNWSASQPMTYPTNVLNQYNAIAPRLTQNQLFENGASSNYNGSTSAQNYLNQSNTGNSSSFQRYRAPSPLYR